MSEQGAISVLERALAASTTEGIEHAGQLLERLAVTRVAIIQALRHLGVETDDDEEGEDAPEYPSRVEQLARAEAEHGDYLGIELGRRSGW